ncbi:calcium-transporting ATPase 3 family protein [Striga asiatica]|uniref:Calcium-transporting ATPase 3 family protein n=1 Tax=Striga asiatica TaxID=4170 RepID=A0A5A7PDS7_STRAF|nr:calcium-transporting ATPase 3 family protein [Striga asiatica]
MENAYARSVSEVLEFFGVDPARGLTDSQVANHGRLYGKNAESVAIRFRFHNRIILMDILVKHRMKCCGEPKGTPFWRLVLKQFDDLLVKILIAAAMVSFFLALANGETGLSAFVEPSVILMILAANAAVGVITETNAEKALEELRAYQADVATVLRNGSFSILPATDLVPGDIVEVSVGCKVPADMRMIDMLSDQLRVDQAILTGESCSVEKELDATNVTNAVYQDKTNILFSGTVVVSGRARAVVVGVGSNTAMGSIRDSMLNTEDEVTPLKKKLDEFGTFLAKVIAGICILVWVVNIGHFRDPTHGGFLQGAIHYFKIAVALAVAAIPEGLPAVVTTRLVEMASGVGVLCDKRVPQRLKGKFYRTAIRTAMLYGAECWPTKRQHVQQLSVAEMRMLRWFCGHTIRDRIQNEDIRDRVGVAPIEEKLVQHRLRWFGHVQRRPPDAPVRRGVLQRVEDVKRGRGRPKFTWEESVKRDLKDWNISKDLAVDKSAWRLAINVPEPCLALGTKRMARLNAIVRSLPSVETLGCTTVICSDKTGTLTTNMMSISKVSVLHSAYDIPVVAEYSVSGTTYAPEGTIFDNTADVQLDVPANFQCLLHTAMCSALCNESVIQYNPEKRSYEKIGESTEVALRVLAEKIGLPGFDSMPSALNMLSKHERASYCNRYWEDQFKKVSVLEFTRDRKMMSVLCNRKQVQIMFSKGAPESILPRCTNIMCNNDGSTVRLTPEIRSEIDSKFHSFAGKETLRCLALALKRMPLGKQALSYDDEKDLTFIGLLTPHLFNNVKVGMLDPPREEVRNAILSCMTAGIRVIVVTGDNKITAESLCKRIGAFDHMDDFVGLSYTASEFENLPALQKTIALQRMSIFTRVEPSHKRMLVEALQHQNEVVAMTGDGVNDAPALKKADIGIAMGSGTAVSKSASDMVLADDNFATIVAAVAEGRAIYNNTKQFIRYMISSNIGEVVCIFVAALLGIPDTLVPVQLLWVNLVTDGLPATAIGFNKQDSDVMKAKPRKLMSSPFVLTNKVVSSFVTHDCQVNEAVVTGWLFFRYLVIGVYVGLATIAGFVWWFLYSDNGPKLPYTELMNFDSCSTRETTYSCAVFSDRHPSTVSMTVLVVVEMFNALNNLSENQSLIVIPPWSNLWLLGSIALTMMLHVLILYVEPLSLLFSVAPLSWAEWTVVLYLSFPVVLGLTSDSGEEIYCPKEKCMTANREEEIFVLTDTNVGCDSQLK